MPFALKCSASKPKHPCKQKPFPKSHPHTPPLFPLCSPLFSHAALGMSRSLSSILLFGVHRSAVVASESAFARFTEKKESEKDESTHGQKKEKKKRSERLWEENKNSGVEDETRRVVSLHLGPDSGVWLCAWLLAVMPLPGHWCVGTMPVSFHFSTGTFLLSFVSIKVVSTQKTLNFNLFEFSQLEIIGINYCL